MSSVSAAARRPISRELRLLARQIYYEQLGFWLNPVGAGFTLGFSVLFLALLGATAGTSRVDFLGNIRLVQYYVPGFAAYGVMSVCFTNLAVSLVIRRETGLLKRIRLSPLPNWMMLGAIFGNALIVSVIQVVILLVIGRVAFSVPFPGNVMALAVALIAGVLCFSALGVAVSTLIPNQDAASPIASTIFFVLLFLSGLWFPIPSGSWMAQASGFFPIRHMITATFAPFDLRPGVSAWSWNDVEVMAIWAVAGAAIAARRFRWEPRHT